MDFLSVFMNVAGGISVSSVVEMLASLILTVRIVTVPIIMRWVLVLKEGVCLSRAYRGEVGFDVPQALLLSHIYCEV